MAKNLQRSKIIEDGERAFGSLLLVSESQYSSYEGFTFSYTCYTISGMKSGEPRPISAIRVKPDILHQARVAAVIRKKTLGRWLEEAIVEKVERERKLNKEART